MRSLPWKERVYESMWISLDFSSETRTPDPDRSVSRASFFMSSSDFVRSSVDPLAETLVRGVLVPVPMVEPASEFLLEALFLAACGRGKEGEVGRREGRGEG